MHLLRVGGEFNGGTIIGIFRDGVLTRKGEYTRFYPQQSVERILEQHSHWLAA
jgi:hypothetical protein